MHSYRSALRPVFRPLLESFEDRIVLNYAVSSIPVHWVELNGDPNATDLIGTGDDWANPINLGANAINFYGTTYTGFAAIWASTNGLITFGSGNSDFANGDLQTNPGQAAISPLWDDYHKFSGSPMVLSEVDAVNNRLIIEWNQVNDTVTSNPVTFEAIMQLNTGSTPGNITFSYLQLDYYKGSSASVGIKDAGNQGANSLVVSVNAVNPLVDDNQAIVFAWPSAVQIPSISSLSPNTATEGDSDLSIDVSGANFVSDSVVQADGIALTTTFVSDSQLQAILPGALLAEEGSLNITVFTPGDSAGTSNPLPFDVTDTPLTASGQSLTGSEGQTITGALVATFRDPGSDGTPADYSATVTWDDGNRQSHTSTGVVQLLAGDTFAVYADNLVPYAEEGTYAVTVVVSDQGGSQVSATSQVQVSDAALTAAGVDFSAIEGASFAGVVATFSDADPNGSMNDFTATIDWGDGQTSAGSIGQGTTGGFLVFGSHTYADEGSYAVSVQISDVGAATTAATSSAVVVDAALSAEGVSIVAAEGTAFSGVVATFTDANVNSSVADFTAVISWWDGNSSAGTVTADGGGLFTVTGNYTYAEEGTYSINILIRDVGGASTSVAGSAAVGDAALSANGTTISALEGNPFTVVLASFTDANANGTVEDFQASIDWGDGATSHGTIQANANGGFNVIGSHAYASAGSYAIGVLIHDMGGILAQANSLAIVTRPVLQIVAPSASSAGSRISITVIAQDANHDVFSGYTGVVHLTTSDPLALLPGDYAFTAVDAGVHTFTGIIVKTAGSQIITVTDSADSLITSSASVTVNPAAASTLIVTGYPSPTTAGAAGTFIVAAKDPFGNIATGYVGTVTFSGTDPNAILPAPYTFTAADHGMHVFTATFKTAGSRSITATDTVTTSISGTQAGISVNAGAATHFAVSRFPSRTTAGVSQSFRVTAQDMFGNTVTGYIGTVAFTSTDLQALLPANYTFAGADGGFHTFSATLKTAGIQSITVVDTGNLSIIGIQSGITVTPAAASQLQVSGFPTSVTAGAAYSFTVTALDPCRNTATDYRGTVAFNSSDLLAVLPANYAFTSADAGVHTFSATLNTIGAQSISAMDTANGAINGAESGINVQAIQPTAGISGPSAGVPGQPLAYTLIANESGLPAETMYVFSVQWGDGSPGQTFSGPAGTQAFHVYVAPGSCTISLTATDPNGNVSIPTSLAVSIIPVLMEADPYYSSLTALYVGGTTGNDTIAITPVINQGTGAGPIINGVKVGMDLVNYGAFYPTGHVVVYGQSGNDIIKTAAQTINGMLTYVSVPALFFAGDGNTVLNVSGSTANNVLVGGAGFDRLIGGQGRDILIGGSGPSLLQAGSGGAILIGGSTSYDGNAAALAAFLAEWGRTNIDYLIRIAHLTGSSAGGFNGTSFLNASTVQADGSLNMLLGGPGRDWYFADITDFILNRTPDEVVTQM